jgi:hypothetical protein
MSQNHAILAHMQRAPITPLSALELYGCFRLAARISDLRLSGHKIVTEWVENNGKRYARYTLANAKPATGWPSDRA